MHNICITSSIPFNIEFFHLNLFSNPKTIIKNLYKTIH